jgi:peptidoglycan-associated lipoprotein
MKQFAKLGLIAILVIASVGGAACKSKRPKNVTPIPEYETTGESQYVDIVPTGPVSPAERTYAPTQPTYTPAQPTYVPPSQPVRQQVPPGGEFAQGSGTYGQDVRGSEQWTQVPGEGDGSSTAQTKLSQDSLNLPTGDIREGLAEDREMFRGNTVYFGFDRSAITRAELAKVAAVAEYLKVNSDSKLLIEGHCDERGTEGYNMALGERRALAIREAMLNMGISGDRITTISYGEARPADTGRTDAAYAKNRRGEFVLLKSTAATW